MEGRKGSRRQRQTLEITMDRRVKKGSGEGIMAGKG